MRLILLFLISMVCIQLRAFTVIDVRGIRQNFEISALANLPRQDLKASTEKEGKIKQHSFSGIRFDNWLREKGFTDFGKIRFESGDKYRVNLSKSELDSLECWLVFASGGKEYESGSSRLVFPSLREMTWIKDVERVILEASSQAPIPSTYHRLDHALANMLMIEDPEPFVNMAGWYLGDLLPKESQTLYLISGDGLVAELEWPRHLEGAILEKDADTINLKSPQIPGGMWIKDLVYLQYGNTALIRDKSIPQIDSIEKALGRQIRAGTTVLLDDGAIIPLGKLMLEPSLVQRVSSFMIINTKSDSVNHEGE